MSAHRDPALWPFARNSPWNMPIATAATYEASTDPATVSTIEVNSTYDGRLLFPFFQAGDSGFEKPVYVAVPSDPLVTVSPSGSLLKPTVTYRIPTAAEVNTGSDGNLLVVTPSRRFMHETYQMGAITGGAATASKAARVDLHGLGTGPLGGIRAYAGSVFAGLIRGWELDPVHPDYTDGVIRHAIALTTESVQYFDPNHPTVTSGYDGRGYGTRPGYTWPATEEDMNGQVYAGNLPVGTLVAIPPSVDVVALAAGRAAVLKIARALQDYGGRFVDSAGSWNIDAEGASISQSIIDLMNPGNATGPVAELRAELRVVSNDSRATPGGGAYPGASRRQPLAPALYTGDFIYHPVP